MKGKFALILSAAMVLQGVSPIFASELDTLYYGMDKAQFESLSYGWEDVMRAERLSFTDGVLAGSIQDFDSDGEDELLVLKLVNSQGQTDMGEKYADGVLEMYESDGSLADTTEGLNLINSSTDAGGLELFTKENRIALECASQNNSFADGVQQLIKIYSYDGSGFTEEVSYDFLGSAMLPEDVADLSAKLEKVGFVGVREYLGEDSPALNPYFTGEEGLNLAKLEPYIVRICEVLIENNNDEIYGDESIMSGYDDAAEALADYARMTVSIKDFTEISPGFGVYVNDRLVDYVDDREMLPLRAVMERLGAEVDYDTNTKEVTVSYNGNRAELTFGNNVFYLNDEPVTMMETVSNQEGYTMVGPDFFNLAFGLETKQGDNGIYIDK